MNHPEANGFEHEESGEALSVTEALDGDLDAYLDRELALEPEVDGGGDATTREAAEDMRALLDLAEEETRWIAESPRPTYSDAEPDETVSESAPVVIPEWMRANPEVPVAEAVRLPWEHSKVVPPAVARASAASRAASQKNTVNEVQGPLNLQQQPWGIPMVPPQQQWGGPMAPGQQHAWGGPVAAPTASNRRRDVVSGVLLGVAAVGALAAGMLVVASVRFWEQGASAPSVLGGVSASGSHVRGSTAQFGAPGQLNGVSGMAQFNGAGTSAQLNGANNTGAQMGTNASGQTGGTASSGAIGSWAIPGVSTGVADTHALNPSAPRYTGPFVTTSPGSISDVANGLHAQGASTDPTRALTSFSGPSGADLMARRDTLAVKSGERRTRTESAPARAPASPTPPQSVAAASGAVMEMTFEEPDSTEQATSVPVDTADDPDGANSTESELDEEFARELGFTDEAEERAAAASEPTATRTVYVPPALEAKEHLTSEDVKQVVVSNQPAIAECLRQHAADTSLEKSGRFMVRWSVQPSGETTNVAMDTDALRATPLAGCIEGVVRGWKFPVHTVRMQEPIRFPFVF
ncbi:AgmX/PglI C-terminal domain-containing protein [Myxococcus qinghaiensis]|uniref:AgmX/PglI C-terminal domain-containing protein n=1 Tax=Myxococcus qinghaiensis TaxID=2906758 RepID=UPI0020A7B2F7|nr:AgmX/PglI C-terminal domain-containing protein [Myxococcus qinghaiensis]MCP3163445.1 AgmX/PglI C-terminal domain-containing protein [Myxococcus qinghaiensis]